MRYGTNLVQLLLIGVFTFFMNVNTLSGQSATLAFTPSGFSGWPDTATAGMQVPVGGYLKNYDSLTTFQDSFRIDGYVDTGSFVFFTIPFYNLYGQFALPPLDSNFVILPIDFDLGNVGGHFHVGNNVVVVWPAAVGSLFDAGDSVFLNVFIIDSLSSTGPEYPNADVRIYPVPSNGPLYIRSYHPQFQVTNVIIRNAAGQEVYRSATANSPIDTNSWPPGLYSVETTLSNGAVSYSKILRQ
jgi:hypothetical protein